MALISDPSLEPSDFRAHGLRGDKSKRYSVKNFICSVQPPGSDVWSRAHHLLNGDWVQFGMTQDSESVSTAWRSEFSTTMLSGQDLKFGELIRHLPEMTRDVVAAGWGHPYVVHVPRFDYRTTSEPPSARATVRFRHAHNESARAMIVRSERDLLAGYTRGRDTLDVIEYTVTTSELPLSGPAMRSDLFGSLHMDFRRRSPRAQRAAHLLGGPLHPVGRCPLSGRPVGATPGRSSRRGDFDRAVPRRRCTQGAEPRAQRTGTRLLSVQSQRVDTLSRCSTKSSHLRRSQSSTWIVNATANPRVVTTPTSLPPCSNASGIIVSASMVRIAPAAKARTKATVSGEESWKRL
jgi:hypothetical protein